MLKIKNFKWVIELSQNCELVRHINEPNGHDCWGNLEFTVLSHAYIDNERIKVFDNMYVVHDKKEIHGIYYNWQLDRLIPGWQKYLKA